jgi:hypothetical protein
MTGGNGEYIGIAPVDHCFDENRNILGRAQPPTGDEIDGYLEAYVIANGGDDARIELPDGEAIYVPIEQVAFQRETDRGSKYVPVGS